MSLRRTRFTRHIAGWSAAMLAVGMVFAAPNAGADTSPAPGDPETVSATPLPTVQINGVVWSQAIIGNTVYAGG